MQREGQVYRGIILYGQREIRLKIEMGERQKKCSQGKGRLEKKLRRGES